MPGRSIQGRPGPVAPGTLEEGWLGMTQVHYIYCALLFLLQQLHLRSSGIRLQRLGTPAVNVLMRVDVDSKACLGVLGLPSQLCCLE